MSKLVQITGKAISGEWGTEDLDNNGILVLRTTNFTNEGKVNYENVIKRNIKNKNLDEKYLRKGDIIIEKSGGSDNQPVGRVVYFDGEEEKYLFNNFTGLLRVKNPNLWFAKYVFYSLFANYKKGGTRNFENKTTGLHNLKTDLYINCLEIQDIDFNEQKQIANTLDKVTALIDKHKKQLEKLDELVKARFVEMFGDVTNNDKNWHIEPLGNLCDISRGGSPRPIEQYLGGTIPWIKIGDATDGDDIYLTKTKEKILEIGIKKSRLVKSGSLIFANCGVSLGFARIITFDGCIHDGWLSFENIDENLDKIFLLKSLNCMTEYFRSIAPSGTQPNLNTAIMKSYKQIVPPIELQNQFADFVKQVEKTKAEVQKSLEQAEILKKALMQKYFG